MEESRPGAVMHMSVEDGRRLCITGMSLVDPAYVPGERVVNVWAEVGQEKHAIGTLSSKEPVVVSVPPVILAGEFVLRHDLAVAAAVRLNVRVLGPPESSDFEEVERVIVLGVDEDDNGEEELGAEDDDDEETAAPAAGGVVEYEPMSEEDVAERYDSDDDGEFDVGGGAGVSVHESRKRFIAPAAGMIVVVPDGEFLGPPRFAVAGNAAGFMWIAAAAAAAEATTTTTGEESKEIVVLYRYTRFSRARRRAAGVETCRRTKLHRLRFAVPPRAAAAAAGGDRELLASSLAWAGSAMGPLIYPGLFRPQLAELWASLLPATLAATNGGVPPGVGRLQVVVDAGILRREDYTPELMVHVRGELVSQVLAPWPAYACYYHVAMELDLPELVPANDRRIAGGGDDDDDDEEEEECSVCFELLKSGLAAAWPGCGHVFHGVCVRKTLERSEMCPLCRHRLSDTLVATKH